MALCERLVDRAPALAADLMARLYPLAVERGHHEVANGIDLWMDHLGEPAVAAALARLCTEGVRPAHLRRLRRWEGWVRRKAQSAGGAHATGPAVPSEGQTR